MASKNASAKSRPALVKPSATGSSPSTGGGQIGPWQLVSSENVMALSLVAVLGVMLLPLPALVLDVLLALSISISLVVFLFSMHIQKPLEFSVFPSLLLVTTLFRLGLNIASTRIILLQGNEGPGAAGEVIQTFGRFVVGGNTLVGVVIFMILVLINFIVVTKGAGRIAEVGARFTLDAMPGKQMAIDADLAAGLINERDARDRRKQIEQEADFFGSMDGASKFVRGDAIAGLVITAVNIIGGLVIGVFQHHMPLLEAASVYTTLTIGDGLVSQIPALLTSVAAGLVTTRASAGGVLGDTIRKQLFGNPGPPGLAAGILLAMALVPGMPHFAFIAIAASLGAIAYSIKKKAQTVTAGGAPITAAGPEAERAELESSLPMDLLEIEVGFELVGLVDKDRDGSLLKRISGVRKQMAKEMGILVPPIHLRDNFQLGGGVYRVMLSGSEIGRGVLRPNQLLAMNPGDAAEEIEGEATTEPAFGLAALWIEKGNRERAELCGYTVVDPATVAATHLAELLAANCQDLLGRSEVQELLDIHGRELGKVIEELIPNKLSMGQFIKVLRNLLRERVSIRDFRTIMEALADHAGDVKDPDQLSELVRQQLSGYFTHRYAESNGTLNAFMVAPEVENLFRRLQSNALQDAAIDPEEIKQLMASFESATRSLKKVDAPPVILSAADVRRTIATFVARHIPDLTVLSYRELDPGVNIQTVGIINHRAALAS